MIAFDQKSLKKKTGSDGGDGSPRYVLRLYVSGMMQKSIEAIKNIKEICELHLKDNYDLSIIDVYQQPLLAIEEQIIVLPVLIIKSPLPERRIIGSLSEREKVLDILK
jgi:circadian clock protein KaiB